MKNNKFRNLKNYTSILLILNAPFVMAQGDSLLDETNEILNSDQINIDGTFRRQTPAERIEKMRKRLESQNEEMVQKKIENIRIKQEKELSGKLKDAFRGKMNALDEIDTVQTVQAAPQTVVAVAPSVEETEGKNRVIPYIGVKQFNGDSVDSFESNLNIGLVFENMVHERVSVGLGVNYTTMDITDRNTFNSFYNDPYYYNDPFNNFNFNNFNGNEITYKGLNLNLMGKYFFTMSSKIRPYAGLGLGYNRMSLKNENQSSFQYDFSNLSEEDSTVSGSNVSASALFGAEVSFTNTLGLNLEFNYTRALTSGFEENPSLGFGSNYELNRANLMRLGSNLEQSDVASLNVGFIVKF